MTCSFYYPDNHLLHSFVHFRAVHVNDPFFYHTNIKFALHLFIIIPHTPTARLFTIQINYIYEQFIYFNAIPNDLLSSPFKYSHSLFILSIIVPIMSMIRFYAILAMHSNCPFVHHPDNHIHSQSVHFHTTRTNDQL
jgi:hypothetical protein